MRQNNNDNENKKMYLFILEDKLKCIKIFLKHKWIKIKSFFQRIEFKISHSFLNKMLNN